MSACFGPLARLDLAAGKFPKSGERFAFRPLSDQHPPVGIDERDGDDEQELGQRRLTSGSRR